MDLAKSSVVHAPVKHGMCLACHESTSQREHRFRDRLGGAKRMCRQCHDARDEKAVTHAPVLHGRCLACHDPHQSDHPNRTRKPVPELCFTCHPSKGVHLREATVPHGALDPKKNPKMCVACHDPHGTDHPNRLKAWPPESVCVTCHNVPLETPTGRIQNLKEHLDRHPERWMRHGPVRDGQCQACHNPHGEKNWRMLKAAFPAGFYAPVESADDYGICFACHDRRLLDGPAVPGDRHASGPAEGRELAWGETAEGARLLRPDVTGFRNGETSLHWKHANKPDKGRTCRACHDFHASPNAKHIRTTTRFGAWEFKLNYEKTATGGSCWPGCHVKREYDRSRAKANPR